MLKFEIQSYSGPYLVKVDNEIKTNGAIIDLGTHFIIDRNVFNIMPSDFILGMGSKNFIVIDATEETKSYQGVEPIISKLLGQGLKRDSVLVALGGGITQDITCFIATTFMRGIKWVFVPTTLLAQADSCIGSKSSINFKNYKNLLGSFTPPNEVHISNQFLDTLTDDDFNSGVGEIAKLFIVGGKSFNFESINRNNAHNYVFEALMIKREYIEEDEFDKGIRNILNYGHCVGHGIETATKFAIPHGIAISIGMDVVNRFALNQDLITKGRFDYLHSLINPIYKNFSNIRINIRDVFAAQTKYKKNTGSKINLVLPVDNKIEKQGFENEKAFWDNLQKAFKATPVTAG